MKPDISSRKDLKLIMTKFYDLLLADKKMIPFFEDIVAQNHLDYFLQTLASEDSNGKKLGFIVQEMGREINTTGSKANFAPMQKAVILMKNELEQIKEQILNVL